MQSKSPNKLGTSVIQGPLEPVLNGRKAQSPQKTMKVSNANGVSLLVNPERDMFNTPMRNGASPVRPGTAYRGAQSRINTNNSPTKTTKKANMCVSKLVHK